MANTTINYGLTKPTQDEFYNVDVQNGNMDIIDTKLKEANTQLSEIANQNLLINGAPSVWQRGTSFNNAQQYTADRWLYICYANPISGSLSKDSDGSIKMTNFNTDQNYIQQIIETSVSEKLAGKKVILSADIKVSNMIKGSVFLQILSSSGIDKVDYSGIIVTEKSIISMSEVSSEYKRFSLTYDLPVTTKTISVSIGSHKELGGMVNSDCIVNIKNIKFEVGSKATTFKIGDIGEELLKCQRYGQIRSTNNITDVDLSPSMRIVPTITQISGGYFYDSEIY